MVDLGLLWLLPGVFDEVGRFQEFREPDGTLGRKHGTRPHVAQEFLCRLLGGPDPGRVFDILANDAGEPQIEFLDKPSPREILRQQERERLCAISSADRRRGSIGRRLRRRSATTAKIASKPATPAAASQPSADVCGTGRGGSIGSRFARLGAASPSSDVTLISRGSVSIIDGSPRRSESGRLSRNLIDTDRIRCLPVCAGSN